jgi:hypothetical protein
MVVKLEIVTKPANLRAISAQIKRVGGAPEVRKRLMTGLRAGAAPASKRVKVAALTLPAKGTGKSTGLRRLMASAVGVQVRASGRDPGVRVRIARSRMGSKAALPKVTNEGVWRHRVFARPGKRQVWVLQRSRKGWFDNTLVASAPPVRIALKKVIDGIEKDLGSH